MSVLGTIWLDSDRLIDRYGNTVEGVFVTVHAASTMGVHVHLEIEYQVLGLGVGRPALEVQLDTGKARALGKALVEWADHEDERERRYQTEGVEL